MSSLKFLAGIGALVATLSAVPALASHRGPGGPHEFATGSASNQFLVAIGSAHLSVSAHRDPATGRVSGDVRAKGDPDGTGEMPFALEGEVTCLDVQGNRAAIKYRFRHAEGSAAPWEGGGVQIFIEDNGEPRNGEAVDATTFDPPQFAGQFQADERRCDDPRTRLYDRISEGNFDVHDAAP